MSILLVGGCDSEVDTEREHQLVVDDVPDELADEVLNVPEPGEEYVSADRKSDTLAPGSGPSAVAPFAFVGWHSEETVGASECPVDQVVTGFDCQGSYCDNVNLECHDYGTSVVSTVEWSLWFEYAYAWAWGAAATTKVMHVCDPDTKMTGIDCWGAYCDNISIRCTLAPGLATDRCTWSGWYSDEAPSPFYAAVGSAIQGVWCRGTHCDDKRFLVCET